MSQAVLVVAIRQDRPAATAQAVNDRTQAPNAKISASGHCIHRLTLDQGVGDEIGLMGGFRGGHGGDSTHVVRGSMAICVKSILLAAVSNPSRTL